MKCSDNEVSFTKWHSYVFLGVVTDDDSGFLG